MKLLALFFASIAGTAAMTLVMYLLSFMTHEPLKVVKILGTMLTFRTTPAGRLSDSTPAIATGIVAHYPMGVAFAFGFWLCWQHGIGTPDLPGGLLFGLVSGLAGVVIWEAFFRLHPHPPQTVPLRHYFISLVLAHVVFGVVVALVYHALATAPFFEASTPISTCGN